MERNRSLWNDGRTGEAGCLAGNLVLAHIRETAGELFTERKGTTFRGRASIWIGRMCSTDAYLNARDRHWANISLDQHREVTSEARLEGSKVKYLFVTSTMGRPEIHYWILPGEMIEQIAFTGHANDAEFVYSLHVRETGSGYEIDGHDVTSFHHVLELSPGDATQLDRAFERTRQAKGRRRGTRPRSSFRSAGADTSDATADDVPLEEFFIPLKGGRAATLSLPVPSASIDLERIKGWIDLMSDVLTEPSRTAGSIEQRRARAVDAVKEAQRKSAESGRSAISSEEIEAEIREARRERRR